MASISTTRSTAEVGRPSCCTAGSATGACSERTSRRWRRAGKSSPPTCRAMAARPMSTASSTRRTSPGHRRAHRASEAQPGRRRRLLAGRRRRDLVRKLVVVSTPIRRDAFYRDILVQQEQVGPEAAEMMKQTPMYQLYASIAPRPQDWGRLLGKIGEGMKDDFDLTKQVATIKNPTMIVAGDADIFPPKHAVEVFELLGGGQRDGGWMGEGRPTARLAILPGITHYAMGSAPALIEVVVPFLDEA